MSGEDKKIKGTINTCSLAKLTQESSHGNRHERNDHGVWTQWLAAVIAQQAVRSGGGHVSFSVVSHFLHKMQIAFLIGGVEVDLLK